MVAEPFRQWVIEDTFARPRPPWELAGAVLTADVAPYEQVKLRLLNGAHSAVAHLKALRGHVTIDAALADPEVRALALGFMDDAEPTLRTPDGFDVAAYRTQVLERFANPAIGYTTLQVAGDGSQKLPIRVVGTVADRLASGVVPQAATRVMATWAVMVARGYDVTCRRLPLDDPLADVLHEAAAGTDAGLADRMLGVVQVFPEQLVGNDGFRATFRREVADLARLVGFVVGDVRVVGGGHARLGPGGHPAQHPGELSRRRRSSRRGPWRRES